MSNTDTEETVDLSTAEGRLRAVIPHLRVATQAAEFVFPTNEWGELRKV